MEEEKDYGGRKGLWRNKEVMEKERDYGGRKELWRKKEVMEEERGYGGRKELWRRWTTFVLLIPLKFRHKRQPR